MVHWEFIKNKWKPWLRPYPKFQIGNVDPSVDLRSHFGIAALLSDIQMGLRSALFSRFALLNPVRAIKIALAMRAAHRMVGTLGARGSAGHAVGASTGTGASSLSSNIDAITKLAQRARAVAQPLLGRTSLGDEVRRACILIDFAATVLVGFAKDDIIHKGYASIDEIDCDEWLKRHHATEVTRRSPIAIGTPNITYNFPRGDMSRGARMSAAAFLQWTFGLIGHGGSAVISFTAGSGESILAPLYRALKEKGVRFEFFHKVKELKLDSTKKTIDSVDIEVQATIRGGGEYQPLFGPVKGLWCWPSAPLYGQLNEGAALEAANPPVNLESWWTTWSGKTTKTLRAGKDFDRLILGISIGGLKFICDDLIGDTNNTPVPPLGNYQSRWAAMIDKIETVQTQAMQLWFKEPMKSYLRDVRLPPSEAWVSGNYSLPISGQEDLSLLLSREDWGPQGPKGVFYFCGPMTDSGVPLATCHDFPEQQHERVRAQCIQYLEATAGPVLPGASTNIKPSPPATPSSLDFAHLYTGPTGGSSTSNEGEERFRFQFWRANIDPTERYVTTQPGGAKYRLEAEQSGYLNLALAGDWIDTGLNVGSVEGAVMGGMLAARVICGLPAAKKDIHGYKPYP